MFGKRMGNREGYLVTRELDILVHLFWTKDNIC